MFGLKKYLPLDLVQLTIVLSFLRLDPESYLDDGRGVAVMDQVSLGSSVAFIRTHFDHIHRRFERRLVYPHSKDVEHMLLSQRSLFYQLNMLGRYNRFEQRQHSYATYLLNGQDVNQADININSGNNSSTNNGESDGEAVSVATVDEVEEEQVSSPLEPASSIFPQLTLESTPAHDDQQLSKEDMDLIEILLRQDVDIGVTRDVWEEEPVKNGDVINEQTLKVKIKEPLKEAVAASSTSSSPEEEASTWLSSLKAQPPLLGCDPWAGLNYTIDSETGEHVVVDEEEEDEVIVEKDDKEEQEVPSEPIDLEGLPDDLGTIFDDINLCLDDEDAQFVSLVEPEVRSGEEEEEELKEEREEGSSSGLQGALQRSNSLIDQLKELEDMIQTTHLHPHTVHHQVHQALANGRTSIHQPRVPYHRSGSMEQRWQDLTNVLSIPPPASANVSGGEDMHHHHLHHHHHHHHHNMGFHLAGSVGGGGNGSNPTPHHHLSNTNYTIPSYASIDNRTTVLLQNATLPPPMADINTNLSYGHHHDLGGGDGIGAAVVTSMSTLANSSDLLGVDGHGGGYSMDVMMFSNGSHPDNPVNASNPGSAVGSNANNASSDGFLSAIINEDDLQLMEMAMNEGDPLNTSSSSSSYPYFLSSRKLQAEGGVAAADEAANHPAAAAAVHAGMYTMRMLDNDDAMDTSSDSAVSSMGSSERVPSISDGQEWMETASDHGEAEQRSYYGMECTQAKYRQFNYSYAPGMGPGHRSQGDRDSRRMPPVAQKKYQLFGKRPTVEQALGGSPYGTLPHGTAAIPPQPTTPIKYPPSSTDYRYPHSALEGEGGSPTYGNLEGATAPPNSTLHAGGGGASVDTRYNCSIDFDGRASIPGAPSSLQSSVGPSLEQVQHNHTYQMSPEDEGAVHRPSMRDKMKKKSSLEEHLSRDEKRARNMKIPITTEDIVNLPMDEFNERLSKYDLTETQLTLIRDIRRRGKNKVAAQNCRKRKLDQIVLLAEEVQEIQRDREMTISEQQRLLSERHQLKDKYSQLYRHVFQSLRDPDGNPYSPYEYSLQQAADGNVILVPRNGSSNSGMVLGSSSSSSGLSNGMAQDNCATDPNKGAKSKRKDEGCRK